MQIPPRITNPSAAQSTVRLVVSSSLVVPCRASGVPDPNIHWERAGVPIRIDNALRVSMDAVGTLRIDTLTKEDSGLYVCVASNVAGEDRVNYLVEVQCLQSLLRPGRRLNP